MKSSNKSRCYIPSSYSKIRAQGASIEFDSCIKDLEMILSLTMDGKIKWHRFAFYRKKQDVERTYARIGAVKDKVEMTSISLDHVGSNRDGRFFSNKNLDKISEFQTCSGKLKKQSRVLTKQLNKERKSLAKTAITHWKSVKKFCIRTSNFVIVLEDHKNENVFAHFYIRTMGSFFSDDDTYDNMDFKYPYLSLTDDDCPSLITLIMILKGGQALVDNEFENSMYDNMYILNSCF